MQKIIADMRVLCYGVLFDSQDEYNRISASTVRESFHRFLKSVPDTYGTRYLRTPTGEDIERILKGNEARIRKSYCISRLHTLDLEIMSENLVWSVNWKEIGPKGCFESNGHARSVDMACCFWIYLSSQWYQHSTA